MDLDSEMVSHPEYDGTRSSLEALYHSPEAYSWADGRVEARFQQALSARREGLTSLRRVIMDGTGTNVERRVRRMDEAKAAGWFVKVVYVRIPVDLAKQRAALRKRSVSPEKIAAYQQKIAAALAVTSPHADEVETIDNFFEDPADVPAVVVIH